jgi:TolB-like protein/DNA-binding winged helix-turn-helix (wHTH) protein
MSATSNSSRSEPIRLAAERDFALGDLAVHPSVREVVRGGERHQVEPRVMQVLVALARADGAVVSRDELILRCWDGRVVGEAAINRCIFKLRELAEAGEGRASFRIETIARVGYRLEAVDGAGNVRPIVPAAAPARDRRLVYAIAIAMAGVVLAVAWFAIEGRPSAPPGAEASIAVLPFKNLSSEPGAAYFAAGIQDEILTRLAKIGSLKVISRTSAEQVAARPGTLKDMAHALGVANILEGSVQRADDKVRVNVQLIRVDTDDHLWAEDYDRKLDDVLDVENDVAGAIALALAAKITPGESAALAAQPTLDRRAYDAYLRGLVLQRRFDNASALEAIAPLDQAVAIDPSFAIAWALLSRTHAFLAFGGDVHGDHRAAARAALDKALALKPDLAEVQLADGVFKYYVDRDFAAAERAFETVHARWPNNTDALHSLGLIERRLGRWAESAEYLREVVTLDPLVPANHAALATTLAFRGQHAAAIGVLDTALSIWPDDAALLLQQIDLMQNIGALERADAVLARMRARDDDGVYLWIRRTQYAYRRQFAEGLRYLEGVHASQTFETWPAPQRGFLEVMIGDFRARTGDAAGARKSYESALQRMLPALDDHPEDAEAIMPIAIAYAGLGDNATAMQYAGRIVAAHPLTQDPLDGYVHEERRAVIASRVGDRDTAIPIVEHLLGVNGLLTKTILRLEPDFDALRGDARFDRLLADADTEVDHD